MSEVQQVADLPPPREADPEKDRIEAPRRLLDCLEDDDESESPPSPMHALFAANPKTALFTPPPTDTPSIDAIAPIQIDALTELIADQITIVIEKDITTTTVEVPNGHFKGATISIKHYPTAPREFNIQLSGSFDHLLDFGQNMKQLYNQLGERMPEHIFRIDAALSEDYYPSDEKKRRQRVQKPKKPR